MVLTYISAETKAHSEVRPQADNNCRLAPISSSTLLDIRFETAPGGVRQRSHAQYPMQSQGSDEIGFAIWKLDLQQQ